MKKLLSIIVIAVLLASCASKKAATGDSSTSSTSLTKTQKSEQIEFLHRICNNHQSATNIVAAADFRLTGKGKDISCDGKLSMRRDAIIRLQLLLPIIRTEIARIDFTPEYVLLVDRYHKEYIKASYKEISFLADNGISFYSLQSLFWNELFLPGQKTLADNQLKRFDCDIASLGATVPVSFKNGAIDYQWTANRATALIEKAIVLYKSQQYGTSSLTWNYANFKTLSGKSFPLTQQFAVQANMGGKTQSAQLSIKMSSLKTTADWDIETKLSSKYKKIEAQDILKKLLSIQ